MLLDGGDPFSVPDYLKEQVAEFEGQYVNPGHFKHYKRFLDNDPDPTKESLYEWVIKEFLIVTFISFGQLFTFLALILSSSLSADNGNQTQITLCNERAWREATEGRTSRGFKY